VKVLDGPGSLCASAVDTTPVDVAASATPDNLKKFLLLKFGISASVYIFIKKN
jgi:hypothetical protein